MKQTIAAFGMAALMGTAFSTMAFAAEHAESGHSEGAHQATTTKVDIGDPEAGKQKAAACAACHGADGNSSIPTFPKIAGQGAAYIAKQLADIKSGVRPVPQMTGFVAGMSEQDMKDIGSYFASQTVKLGKADPKLVELGRQLYRAGNADSGVTACASCHGATGKGMPSAKFPSLSGQHADYIAAQLKAFRASGRGDEAGPYRENDGDSRMMRATAAHLTDSEIKALSSYISGLH